MKTLPFRHITIIGVGLIGGSLGLAIKRRFPRSVVTGVDRQRVLRKALARKAIDRGTKRISEAVRSSDLVILATPMDGIMRFLPQVAKGCTDRTIVTDVGSVKTPVLRAAKRVFPRGNFIGGHPMAGVELSGVEAAHPLLFENVVYVLTPDRKTKRALITRFSSFLAHLGARPLLMDASVHDQVAAAVSHLPQLTAVALMNVAGRRHPSAGRFLRLAAGGFRDLTRIASSRFDLWSQILPMNRKEIMRSLNLLIDELRRYKKAVGLGETRRLRKDFKSARTLRNSIPRDMKGFIHPLAEIQVFVKDQPGMLAKLTTALARATINIKDLELMKVREGRGGTFRIAFESKEIADTAGNVLERAGYEVGDKKSGR